MIDLDALKAPFPPEAISWRVGSMTKEKDRGMALAYIDSRDVQARLDEVCGVGGWQCRYPHAAGKTICEIGIKVGDEWVWKADGAGDSDIEAEKGAISDAFKRAAVKWGIGRYLYDIESPWVAVDKFKRIEAAELPRLHKLLGGTPRREAPVPTPTPSPAGTDTARDTEITAYLAITQTAMANCDNLSSVRAWWDQEEKNRKKLGLIEGSPRYKELVAHVDGRQKFLKAQYAAFAEAEAAG